MPRILSIFDLVLGTFTEIEGGEASASSRCANGPSRAVPGTVHRLKTSRVRRLRVLAVGAHPWIGSGEPLAGAVHSRRLKQCGNLIASRFPNPNSRHLARCLKTSTAGRQAACGVSPS
jgi:hypothetical protein